MYEFWFFFLINETKKQILVYNSVGIVRAKVLFTNGNSQFIHTVFW